MPERILWSRMRSSENAHGIHRGVRAFRGGGVTPQEEWLRDRRTSWVDRTRHTEKAQASRSAGFSTRITGQAARARRQSGHRAKVNARKAETSDKRSRKSTTTGQARADVGDSNSRARRIHVVRKLVLGVTLAVVAIIAGEIIFQTVLAPNLAINRIRLRGDSVVGENELLEIAGLSDSVLYFHVDSDAIASRLEEIPEVSEASVRTDFPDTLTISITAREPIAVTSLSEDEESVPAVIDKEGVVFRTGLRAGEYDLPVISGLRLERFKAGDRLPEELTRLFDELGSLRINEPELFSVVSEIRVVRRAGEYESIMYPTYAAVPVRMPARVEPDRYEAALHSIEALDRRGELGSVDEIDMRSGDVVYTTDAED